MTFSTADRRLIALSVALAAIGILTLSCMQLDVSRLMSRGIDKQQFPEQWLAELATAYGDIEICPEEFRKCYYRFYRNDFTKSELVNAGYEKDLLDHVRYFEIPSIVMTPRNKKLALFNLHCQVPSIERLNLEVFDLLFKEYVEGGTAAAQKERVQTIHETLTAYAFSVEQADVGEFVGFDLMKLLQEPILDCEAILDRTTKQHSKRFWTVIVPSAQSAGVELPDSLLANKDALKKSKKGPRLNGSDCTH